MKKLFCLPCFFLLFGSLLLAQSSQWKHPDEFLLKDTPRAKVLLVGTYHFAYPNQDAYKIGKEDQVDILSPKKQAELDELVDYLAKFKPTKLMVESGPITGYIMYDYKKWKKKKGKNKLKHMRRSETYQIGFRLLDKFNFETVYGVDAGSILGNMYRSEDSTLSQYAKEMYTDYDYKSDDIYDARFDELYDYETELEKTKTLLEVFKYLNDEKSLRRTFGAYLIGDFRIDKYRGADVVATNWYNRNLRIFRNIQKVEHTEEDRILVLFGQGHVPILKQLFECSPEYELVEFSSLDKL
ncbi:MAG: DUF5694 domain-containing protein [Bacteroidota bacterium]